MKTISSRQHPVVRACRALAASPDPIGGRLLLDGAHLVQEARAAGYRFEMIAVSAAHLEAGSDEARLARTFEADGVPVFAVSSSVLAAVSPVRTPSGLVAVVQRDPCEPHALTRPPDAFVLLAVNVQDPGNLGAIVRAAEAGGVTGVLVSGVSAHPWSWKTLRGSMGSALRLPIATLPDANDGISAIKGAGLRLIAAVPRGGRLPEDVDWTGRLALAIGGEGAGLNDAVAQQADAHVSIPMAAPVESLNVAVAAALLVYAARRQRLAAKTLDAKRAGRHA